MPLELPELRLMEGCVWLCTHVALVTSFARERAPARSCLLQARSLAVSGTYAYVVGETSDSLAVVDVSTPSSPTLAGSLIDSTNMKWVSCCAHDVAAACACLPRTLHVPCCVHACRLALVGEGSRSVPLESPLSSSHSTLRCAGGCEGS